ncbi:MAG: sugar kinase [Steroidobacteraceae bacterium]
MINSVSQSSRTADGPRVVVAGECILELVRQGELWQLGAAGDSFTTGVYLQRLGARVRFFTALGTDPFSDEMLQTWASEGLDTSLVLRDPARLPGLHAIHSDDRGERCFYSWRQQAAVRQLFKLAWIDTALQAAVECDLLYLTGITLSLFDATERRRWVELATQVRRRGGRVAFDPNYRPKGWASAAEARAAMESIAPLVSILLTTNDDEKLLFGHRRTADSVAHWRNAGVAEVVVKLGSEGAAVHSIAESMLVTVPDVVQVVDSAGAGDSFNAAYLAARMAGASMERSAHAGNLLAGAVVQGRGAVLPAAQMPATIAPLTGT